MRENPYGKNNKHTRQAYTTQCLFFFGFRKTITKTCFFDLGRKKLSGPCRRFWLNFVFNFIVNFERQFRRAKL